MQHPLTRPTAIALGAALVVAASACESDRAVAPPPDATVDALDQRIAAAFAEGLNVSMEDAGERLAPSLGDELGPLLRGHLQDLSVALAAGDVTRARGALLRAEEVLARVGATPDAGAIGLLLEYTATLLGDVRR